MNDSSGPRDKTVDRNALGEQLPYDAEAIAEWVRFEAELITGPASDWTDDEREQFGPACRILVDVADAELDDAQRYLRFVQSVMTDDPQAVLEKGTVPRARTVAQVEEVKADLQPKIRRVVRAYLRDVLKAAQALGVGPRELAELLGDVVDASSADVPPEAHTGSATVISLGTARARHGRELRDRKPHATD